ncbi:hypothetical protein AB3Y40_20370 [Yoonia sp. R2331]|uniref:hypothetical protein n=1 Tax=Yoonia sp. R2331 TaxID=3237238 RepID=UPI0034E4BCA1
MAAVIYGTVASITTLASYLFYDLNLGQLIAIYYASAALAGLCLHSCSVFCHAMAQRSEPFRGDQRNSSPSLTPEFKNTVEQRWKPKLKKFQ